MNEIALARQERFFGEFASGFAKMHIVCKPIIDADAELAYTTSPEKKPGKKGEASMFIARQNRFYEGLKDDTEYALARFGLCVHEMMHQILTDFEDAEYTSKLIRTESKRNLFRNVHNIIDDPRIEYFADDYVGGPALTALYFVIGYTYRRSKEINPKDSPVIQVLNCLIQLGDKGSIKGEENLRPESKEALKRILPYFYKGVTTPDGKEAVMYSYKIFKILEEFMLPDEIIEMMEKAASSHSKGQKARARSSGDSSLEKKLKKLMKKLEDEGKKDEDAPKDASEVGVEAGAEMDGDDAEEAPADKGEESSASSTKVSGSKKTSGLKKATASKKASCGEAKNDTADSKDAGDSDEAESFDETPDEGDEEKDCSCDEEAPEVTDADKSEADEFLKASIKKIEEAEEATKAAESSDKSEVYEVPKEFSSGRYYKAIENRRIHSSSTSKSNYEIIRDSIKPQIRSLERSLSEIFETIPESKERCRKGKLNSERYLSPAYTGTCIFDKKIDSETKDAAIMLVVDQSGSMGYSRMEAAKRTAIMLAEVCAKLNIPCYVMGYSADEGGLGMINHLHYTTFKNRAADRWSIADMTSRSENRDGGTILYASKLLSQRSEKNKLMIVISDGQPSASGYRGSPAIQDTKFQIKKAKRDCEILGICINEYDQSALREMYAGNFIVVNELENLPRQLSRRLTLLASRW